MKLKLVLTVVMVLVLAVTAGAQQIVAPYIGTDNFTPVFAVVNLTATTSAKLVVSAQQQNVRTYITSLQCINQGGVDVVVTLWDGGLPSGANGTVKTYIPCDSGLGGNNPLVPYLPPLKMSAATSVNAGIGTSGAIVGLQGVYFILNGFTSR